MCLVYFHAGVGKIGKEEWSNGTAVYYWFNDPTFGMPDFVRPLLEPILANPLGVITVTWGVIFLEILLFMAIIMNDKPRYFLFYPGLAFHLLIIVIHGLFSFFFAMAGGLLLYLWVDNEYSVTFEKPTFRRWLSFLRAAPQ